MRSLIFGGLGINRDNHISPTPAESTPPAFLERDDVPTINGEVNLLQKHIRRFFFVAAGLFIVMMVACGGGAIKVEKGDLVSGIITSSDSGVDGRRSKVYLMEIFEDVEYFVRLTSPEGSPVGLWNPVAEEYIVEIASGETGRTVAYVFAEGDQHELIVRSPESEVPAPFTFTFWITAS